VFLVEPMSTNASILAIHRTRQGASADAPWTFVIAFRRLVLLCGIVLTSGCAALVPPPTPPAPAPEPYTGPTCAKLLGVPDCIAAGQKCAELICQCIQRQFPGPGTPPVLGEVGPEASPAVKCAAEILAEEAKAPQKIDAIRYLGRVGCTKCYPCVEEGLLAALDDCTEEVRFEAAKALRRTATENCRCCRYTSCCSQKVFDKLNKIAFDTRDDGCFVEPSARVRRMARQALEMCGSPTGTPEEPTPSEGPSGAMPAPLPAPEGPAAETPPAEEPPPAAAPAAAATPTTTPPAAAKPTTTPPAVATPTTPPVAAARPVNATLPPAATTARDSASTVAVRPPANGTVVITDESTTVPAAVKRSTNDTIMFSHRGAKSAPSSNQPRPARR
jgi:hypothetical protein